jgi:hypothetical protein
MIFPTPFKTQFQSALSQQLHIYRSITSTLSKTDNEDWACEAAEMATIYDNSYVTIAATASEDSSEACFRASDSPAHNFTTTLASRSKATFYSRKGLQHYHPLPFDTTNSSSSSSS